MDKIREDLREHIKDLGLSESEASRRIGQHRGYLHEFLSGKQRALPYEVRLAIHEKLGMPLTKLALINVEPNRPNASRYAGFGDDAVPYALPPGTDLPSGESLAWYVMTSDALEKHPLGIAPGDRLQFDISSAAVANIESEKIVIAQCYPIDTDILSAKTIVREYIRPGLLITNRSSANEIVSLSDPDLAVEVHIKGVFKRLMRE